MAIIETARVASLVTQGDAIGGRHMGMNLVLGYERFGSKPWEKFDEVQTAVNSALVRFPGGIEAETLFDYRNPQAGTALTSDGRVLQLITPDAFLAYAAARGSKATIVLPMEQLLTNATYGARDFDAAQAAHLRAYVASVLDRAGPAGIATFELGNEYESWMTSTEYGRVASAAAVIVQQEIQRYYGASSLERPDIAVQVWGQSAGGGLSLSDLAGRNQSVLAQFSTTELAAITTVTSHFYYTEGKFTGLPNVHAYGNIDTAIGYSVGLMQAWSTKSGRPMDMLFSEWNVQMADVRSHGVQQIPILLEMFSSFVTRGVDEMNIWSTMYNGTALATYRGELQASGVLMGLMSRELQGMKVAEVPVGSANYDIHGFTDGTRTYLYISSLVDDDLRLNLDLSDYLGSHSLTSVRLIEPDATRSDGVYRGTTGLEAWEDPDTPILIRDQGVDQLLDRILRTDLDAHETLILELVKAPARLGSQSADRMQGRAGADRIDARESHDLVNGLGGNDTLFGGDGRDTLNGDNGNDRLWGGGGSDWLHGGNGDDRLEGRMSSDMVRGGNGDDFVSGGDAQDTLSGGYGEDSFFFRKGETGHDIIEDFKAHEGDYLIYDAGSAVDAGDFTVQRQAVVGMGGAAADLVIAIDGAVMAILLDVGDLTHVTMQDAHTGAIFDLN